MKQPRRTRTAPSVTDLANALGVDPGTARRYLDGDRSHTLALWVQRELAAWRDAGGTASRRACAQADSTADKGGAPVEISGAPWRPHRRRQFSPRTKKTRRWGVAMTAKQLRSSRKWKRVRALVLQKATVCAIATGRSILRLRHGRD